MYFSHFILTCLKSTLRSHNHFRKTRAKFEFGTSIEQLIELEVKTMLSRIVDSPSKAYRIFFELIRLLEVNKHLMYIMLQNERLSMLLYYCYHYHLKSTHSAKPF